MWPRFSWKWLWDLAPSTRKQRRSAVTRRSVQRKGVLCEILEDRLVPSTILGIEQEFVYLLNRARHDPAAYQREYNLPVNLSGVAPRPPLAVNDALFRSTGFHATDMANRNYFAHNTPEGVTPNQMVRNNVSGTALFPGAGYVLPSFYPIAANNVESIAAGNAINTAAAALNLLIIDAGLATPGHRIQLLAMNSFFATHREVGVGFGFNLTSRYDNYWAIHTAVSAASDQFITGVIFNDTNGDLRYQAGEGVGGVTVTLTSGNTVVQVQANAQGGYSIPIHGLNLTSATVSIAGSSASVSIGSDNIAVDFIVGNSTGIVNFNGPPPNRAPVLNNNVVLPNILEDETNPPGVPLSPLLSPVITDPNPGDARGMAIVSTTGDGIWQYSTDNFNSVIRPFGSVSAASALLLPDTYQIRFVPTPDFNGRATFTFRAWDQTSGVAEGTADVSTASAVGGNRAFSAAIRTAILTVTPVNDAPVLTGSGTASLPDTREDTVSASVTLGSLVGSAISDVDAGALKGVAIIAADNSSGTWQFSINGGQTFSNLGNPTPSAALLLRDIDRIRFVPHRNFNGTATLTLRAWDRTEGTAGGLAAIQTVGGSSAYSTQTATVRVTVTPVNDAPYFLGFDLTFNHIARNVTGQQFRLTVNRVASDPIVYEPGIANGVFHVVRHVQAALDALLGTGNTQVRLSEATPTQLTLSVNFTAALARTDPPLVSAQNISLGGGAPLVSASSPWLPSVQVANPNPAGTSVSALAGRFLADVDTGALKGIAVIGTRGPTTGQWQYSLDQGASYLAFGAVSPTVARLLPVTALVRFVPDPTFTLVHATTALPSLLYRAWDQTTGTVGSTASTVPNSGITAFSRAFQIARVRVNDAPVLTPTNSTRAEIPSTQSLTFTVASLLGSSVQDSGTATRAGIAITGLTSPAEGRWQYSLDGGITFRDFPVAPTPSQALLLRSTDRLRYIPQRGQTGSATLRYRAWDQTVGLAGQLADLTVAGVLNARGAFSNATDRATVTIV